MVRKPIILLDKEFKTQKEFEKYVKKIIYDDIGICNDIKNIYPDKYNILIKILERHPDFDSKTENMCNLIITRDKLNKKALKILIKKNNNDIIDISWRCAITGKHTSKKSELASALRSSIDNQIHQFKAEHKNDCCKLCGSVKKLHVDHDETKNSTFDELVFNFLAENKNLKIPDKFGELNDDTHRRCFLNEDNTFKEKWVEYHYNNASLRMLCEYCNLTRPKSKKKF